MSDFLDRLDLGPWMRPLCVLTAAALAGWCAHVVLFWFVQRLARRRGEDLVQNVVRPLRRPSWVLLPVLAMHAALPLAGLPFDIEAALEHGLAVVLILAGAWLSMAGLEAVQRFLARRQFARLLPAGDQRREGELEQALALFRKVAAAYDVKATIDILPAQA